MSAKTESKEQKHTLRKHTLPVLSASNTYKALSQRNCRNLETLVLFHVNTFAVF